LAGVVAGLVYPARKLELAALVATASLL